MKATIISMFVVLGLMVGVPMYVMNDDDLMSDLFGAGDGKESIASLKKKAPKNITNVAVKEDVKMYKWVDENGVMQFSQTPPPGAASEEMTLKANLNTMERPYMPEPESAPTAQSGGFAPGNPYNPGKMKEMMQQSKELQKQINESMAKRKAAMDEMMK